MNKCNHEFEYAYTIDKAVPGDIISTAVFKCIKCGEEFNEWEIENEQKLQENTYCNVCQKQKR